MIIAVDGPAASGKGTLARRIAAHMGFARLDTGKLYRAVGIAVLREGNDPADEGPAVAAAKALRPETLDDTDLAGDAAAQAASIVSAIPAVRATLLAYQRAFADDPPDGGGAVLDGRDIGTVVCPGADIKFFVTASAEVRAKRRYKELLNRGETIIYARVLQDLKERDARDSTRSVSPMRPAEDAIVLDTTDLDAEAVFAAAVGHIEAVSGGGLPAG